ncbi:MAG: hypothetical protein QOK29_5108 [Rhodospirillaceae bacterium]|jgi:hypothetical protein|nr:hypothetical protein [Rhodospirillaceae bacterium]
MGDTSIRRERAVMTSTRSARRHGLRAAGAILSPERPDSVTQPPAPAAAFDLEVTQNRRLGPLTTVRLLDLHSTGSRDLTSATVFCGDGTTSRIAL